MMEGKLSQQAIMERVRTKQSMYRFKRFLYSEEDLTLNICSIYRVGKNKVPGGTSTSPSLKDIMNVLEMSGEKKRSRNESKQCLWWKIFKCVGVTLWRRTEAP